VAEESAEEVAARRAIALDAIRALQAAGSSSRTGTGRTTRRPSRPGPAQREAEEERNRRAAERLLAEDLPQAGS